MWGDSVTEACILTVGLTNGGWDDYIVSGFLKTTFSYTLSHSNEDTVTK